MSIPASRKPLLSLAALASVGGLFAAILGVFLTLAGWAERHAGSYPFKQEDWLRYLLPSPIDEDASLKIMLAGPSTVRENFRVEQVEAAFPDADVLQGGISLGAIEDVTTGLQYLEAVHGADALPDILILGVSPRFVAGIPGERPFQMGIDLYSPHYRIAEADGDMTLVEKSPLEALEARVEFLARKQPERLLTAIWATVHRVLEANPALLGVIDRIGASPLGARLGRVCFEWPVEGTVIECFGHRISPYKYAWLPPLPEADLENWLTAPDSWWAEVFAWEAARDQTVRARLAEFRSFVDAHGIGLLVLNMPERDLARDLYEADYSRYTGLLRETFGRDRVVDLRTFLRPGEFYDAEHSVPEGSSRLTRTTIALIEEMTAALPSPVAVALPRD